MTDRHRELLVGPLLFEIESLEFGYLTRAHRIRDILTGDAFKLGYFIDQTSFLTLGTSW